MLKFKLRPGFSDRRWWLKHRDQLVFDDEAEMTNYQDRHLRFIKSFYGISVDPPISSDIPPCVSRSNAVEMRTSGTTSRIRKHYLFPADQWRWIEEHHIWRIEKSHGLSYRSNTISFFYNHYYYEKEGKYYEAIDIVNGDMKDVPYGDAEDRMYNAVSAPAFGSHNQHYKFSYNQHTSVPTWRRTLESIRKLNPKWIMMTPSQFQTIWILCKDDLKFDCPIIFSGECLDASVRSKAEALFPKVIDKMRCWDGGLGFFECPHGTRHIYDELSLVSNPDNKIVSTDFYNYCHPFVNYWNKDMGVIKTSHCQCGCYGNHVESIQGRSIGAIKVGDSIFPGSIIKEQVGSFLCYGSLPSIAFRENLFSQFPRDAFADNEVFWKLHQHADESIEFRYHAVPALNQVQESLLHAAVDWIVLRKSFNNKAVNPLEGLLSMSDVSITYIQDEEMFSGPHKNLAVSSECV